MASSDRTRGSSGSSTKPRTVDPEAKDHTWRFAAEIGRNRVWLVAFAQATREGFSDLGSESPNHRMTDSLGNFPALRARVKSISGRPDACLKSAPLAPVPRGEICIEPGQPGATDSAAAKRGGFRTASVLRSHAHVGDRSEPQRRSANVSGRCHASSNGARPWQGEKSSGRQSRPAWRHRRGDRAGR